MKPGTHHAKLSVDVEAEVRDHQLHIMDTESGDRVCLTEDETVELLLLLKDAGWSIRELTYEQLLEEQKEDDES